MSPPVNTQEREHCRVCGSVDARGPQKAPGGETEFFQAIIVHSRPMNQNFGSAKV
jgi:hypothetical protein